MEGPRGWGRPLHDAVLDACGTGPGSTVLDLGCGTGEFAAAALSRGAVVTGIDADPRAVAIAGRDVPGARFAVGDAHDPPRGRFDLVAAVQLLPHLHNPVVALRKAGAAGVLVAMTVWGRDEECDVGAFGAALQQWVPPRPPRRGPAPLTDPDRLRRVVGLAGLEMVALDEVRCAFDYPDVDALVGPVLESAIGREAARRAGPQAVRAAVLDRLARRQRADGSYRLLNTFRVGVARVSGPAPRPAP